jgi:salicylate hydroxylase
MHGFAGQGAAQALESCAVLTHLFSRVEGPEQIEAAFQAYDAARRPRSQAVVELTRRYGRVYAYAEPDVGHDLAKIRAFFQEAAAFTNDADLERQNRDAMAFYESYLPKI